MFNTMMMMMMMTSAQFHFTKIQHILILWISTEVTIVKFRLFMIFGFNAPFPLPPSLKQYYLSLFCLLQVLMHKSFSIWASCCLKQIVCIPLHIISICFRDYMKTFQQFRILVAILVLHKYRIIIVEQSFPPTQLVQKFNMECFVLVFTDNVYILIRHSPKQNTGLNSILRSPQKISESTPKENMTIQKWLFCWNHKEDTRQVMVRWAKRI